MNPLITQKDLKAYARQLLADAGNPETETDKRRALKAGAPFPVSSTRHSEWLNACNGVIHEKPSKKLLRSLDELPDHLTEWAVKNRIIK